MRLAARIALSVVVPLALAGAGATACGDAGGAVARSQPRGVIVFAARSPAAGAHVEVRALRPGAGPVRTLAAAAGRDFYPAPGPGGIAVGVDERDGHVETLVRFGPAAGGRALAPLVPPGERVRDPSVAPDASFLVFAAESDNVSDLHRLDLRTGARTRLTDDPEGNFEPALSPDGREVAFSSSRDGDSEIYVMPAAGGEARRLTTFHRDDFSPAWSPDGRWIAFLSDREGADRIFVVRPDGTDVRRLTPGAVTSHSHRPEAELAWSPDSRTIAYVVHDAGRPAIWLMELDPGADGAAPRRLSPEGVAATEPVWSPDGTQLVYVERSGHEQADLVLVHADGSNPIRLTSSPGEEWLPRWLPEPDAPEAPAP